MSEMTWTLGSATLSFAPTYARIVEPHQTPIQRRLVAESGHSYVYNIVPAGTELELPVEFEDLPEADESSPVSTAGYSSLTAWLVSVVSWHMESFTVSDPDGATFTCRYWGGYDTLREAAGRSRRQGSWTGVVLLRRV